MHISTLLENKRSNLLNIYCTAGYPKIDSLLDILPSLELGGVEIIEVGIPYSDPLSDGPTIQSCNAQALKNGITIEGIFNQIKICNINTPIIIMGYYNSIFQYGFQAFCERCNEIGVSGLIIPDLPIDIYKEKYLDILKKNDLSLIFLITPSTSTDRIRMIDDLSTSFIYAVSSASTTGKNKDIMQSKAYLEKLGALKLKHPILTGFNIKDKSDVLFVNSHTNGAIIGSAFLRHISNSIDLKSDTIGFVRELR